MCWQSAVVASSLLLLATCAQDGNRSVAPQGVTGPSDLIATSPERPWKANMEWAVVRLEWAGEPFSGVTSTFDGRCSVASDYVIYGKFWGQATHAGRFSGEGSHCSQLHMSPQGPGEVTYVDGEGRLVAANGSTLLLRWGHGTSGFDAATGTFWFKDQFTFAGGTGLFEGATGGGQEGGSFEDFQALLAGTPATMWMEGTITYGPGKR
jgi:hypothetical protein